MTPTGPEILTGGFMALLDPPPPESGGEFTAGKVAVVAMLCFLMAQEVERGAAVRFAENRGMRQLFEEAANGAWAPGLTNRLHESARGEDLDINLSSLDRRNSELRTLLIALHEAVEASSGAAAKAREKRILRLLREGATARRLELPQLPAG